MGARIPCARDPQASLSLPLSAAIDLREIHLARQSSLQVPVGHIVVPGGIKLCSPGTFWVANYLIINNGSCQVNFTKPNMATIRYTNSQWPRGDGSEVPVGRVAVPKTCQKTPSSREDATEMPVGRGPVPKTGQKNASPRGLASELSVTGGAVPNPVANSTIIPSTVPLPCPSARDPAPEVLQLRVPVPKCL